MGKGSTSADQSGVFAALASAQAADKAFQLGEDQLNWAKTQWNAEQPLVQQAIQGDIASQQQAFQFAQEQEQFYKTTYEPLEQQYAQQAQQWASPGQQAINAGAAMTNVSEASEAQRTAAQQQLEGFGINPGSTRFAGLDIGSRTTQAAAEAGAGTSAVQATKLQGLGLEAGVVNTGRGLPNTVAGLASTGVGAGAAGTGASQSNIATGSSAMTAPSNWFNTGASNMNTYVNAVNGYNQSQLGYAQVGAMQTAGFGALAGGLAGAFLQQGGPAISLSADMPQITQPTYSNPPTGSPAGMIGYPSGQHEERQVNAPVMIDRSASRQPYSGKGVYGRAEGRGVPLYRQAGGAIPPQGNPGNVTASPGATVQSALPPNGTPGGAIPPEASPSQGQQTDDVPARLTVGEFVNPRDVVEWKGQEFFYKQIDKIRQEAAAAKARTDIGGEQGYAPPARPTFVSRPQVVASNPAIPHARGVQYGGPITPGVNSGWSGAGPSTTYGAQSGAIPTQRLLQRRAVG